MVAPSQNDGGRDTQVGRTAVAAAYPMKSIRRFVSPWSLTGPGAPEKKAPGAAQDDQSSENKTNEKDQPASREESHQQQAYKIIGNG